MPSFVDTAARSLTPSPGVTALLLYTLKGATLGLGIGTICLPWHLLNCLFELRDQGPDKKGYVLSWAKMGAGAGCVIGLYSLFNTSASSVTIDNKCTCN